jgi:peptidyl-prolyl cis-trans isomerase B (cyclophilin B)
MQRKSKQIATVGAAVLIAALVAALLAGCGGDDDSGKKSVAGCKREGQPQTKPSDLSVPSQTVKRGDKLTAVVKTSCGTFEIALDAQRAPQTVNSFVHLAEQGFYNGLSFHRIVPGFVIQGGDPRGDGTGGPGYTIDEKPPANLAYTRGTVAMAKSAAEPPGRSGSQFFVVTGADAGLPPDYALVGRVSQGMNVVERIDRLGTPTQRPIQPVLIDKITIEKG